MNLRRISVPAFCAFLGLLLCCVSPALAQSTDARISGLITDPSKAVIVNARVIAVNAETGAKFPTKTNKSGLYFFSSLPAGKYRLEVEHIGFKSVVEGGITLHVQEAAEINFEMAVGSHSETVTVNAGHELTQTTGTVSTVIDRQLIENMPLNGKDLTTLFELSPGTLLNAGGSGQLNGGGFSVDGQRPTANYLSIDGASGEAYVPTYAGENNTGAGIATSASGGTNGILPVDAIEEYRMDTSTYTAENGRTPGGQIQVRTRGGTNQFHGTLFENFRNQVLNANDWFSNYNHVAQSPLRMNEFGGTLGGPILKNRLFFFVANDNLILDQPNTVSQSDVPDPSVISGAYPAFKTFLSIFPSGNGGQIPNIPSFDYFSTSYPYLIRDHTTSVRLDWQLPRSMHAFFRANIAPSSSLQPGVNGGGSNVNVVAYTGGLTVPLGNRMLDELIVNHTSNKGSLSNFVSSIGGNNPDALRNNLPTGVNLTTDLFEFSPYTSGYGAYNEGIVGPSSLNKLDQWNIVDTFSLQRGRNALKFGLDFLDRQSSIQGYSHGYVVNVLAGSAPPYTNTDLDTGIITSLQYYQREAQPIISLSNTSLFVNDEWKTNRTLTLNAGLRWEFNPAPSISPLGMLAVVGDNLNPSTFQAALSNQPLYQTRYDNFAPRFGFSWTPRPQSGMAVRGGIGIYFDTAQAGTTAGTSVESSYPYAYNATYAEIPYASVSWDNLAATQSSLAESSLYLVDPHLLSPRTYEWSVTLEQQFGKNSKLSTSYVGNDGEKLVGEDRYYNGKNSAGQYPVNTTYVTSNGNLYVVTNQSHSNYQALQIQLTSRMGERLNALASYTWGHSEDNGSTNFTSVGAAALNPIANSANDIRQMFSTAIHYTPEELKENRILLAVTSGWELDTIARIQTASPLTVIFTNNAVDNVNQYLTNADVVAGQPAILHEHIANGTVVPGNILLNHAAFQAPPTGPGGSQLRNGNSPTNGYRLFGLTQWDLAASRSWKIWEGLNLNFRVDAFNLLNTANFSSVSNVWNTSNVNTFGRSSATYASTYGASPSNYGQTGAQLNVFENGGPRELQFSMKLKF